MDFCRIPIMRLDKYLFNRAREMGIAPKVGQKRIKSYTGY